MKRKKNRRRPGASGGVCDQINSASWSIKDCQAGLGVHQVDLGDLLADRQAGRGGHLADRQADLAGHLAEMDQ